MHFYEWLCRVHPVDEMGHQTYARPIARGSIDHKRVIGVNCVDFTDPVRPVVKICTSVIIVGERDPNEPCERLRVPS